MKTPFKVIESKQLAGNLDIPTLEIILDEMNIFLIGLCNPLMTKFLFYLNNAYNFFCTTYENITLIGDFNMIPGNKN